MSADGWQAFWSMGGYARYVWGCFGAGLAVYLWNWIAPRRRRRAIIDAQLEARVDE
jgi:heme exporter protein CcmD